MEQPSTAQRIRVPVVLLLTFFFLLLLSQGFVTSGDDWYFTSRTMDENLFQAIEQGYGSAVGHYRSTNGRLLGNALSKGLGCSEFWREITRCGIILLILVQICRMSKIRSSLLYAFALMLCVALPADLYSQAYAWAAGFFNYVPPLVLILLYLFRVDSLAQDGTDHPGYGIGMFLAALASQLFVENVTVGLCLLSAGVLVWYLLTRKKLSWSLCGHLLGAILGCIVMFAAPGYSNVNQEGYRQVSATYEELMKVIQSNFSLITMYLTERNWLVIVPLTALSILLLLRSKPEKSWIRTARGAALIGLMVGPVYFYANYNVLRRLSYAEWVNKLRFWLDCAANLAYLVCVLAAVGLGVRDPQRKRRGILCIAAVPLIFAPLVVVIPIGPRCLYIPYMLLVCLMLILAADAAELCSPELLRYLRIPAGLTVLAVLLVYLWIGVWNGHCEKVRTRQIENAMSIGASSVVLPSYPYTDYVHNGDGSAMRYYYYYEEPGDLAFEYVYHQAWFQN